MKTLTSSLALCAVLVSSGANAALESRLGGLAVYDTDLNVTWLADANLAATNTFGLAIGVDLGTYAGKIEYGPSVIREDSDGDMTWGAAMKWIGEMNASGYLGQNNWRLPTMVDTGTPGCSWGYMGTDCGYNVNTSTNEMAHLFTDELGNQSSYDSGGQVRSGGLTNTGPFSNFRPQGQYWTGTEYAPELGIIWVFQNNDGKVDATNSTKTRYALAVRDGDIAAVPVPAAAWLLGSGLLGLIGVGRRNTASR